MSILDLLTERAVSLTAFASLRTRLTVLYAGLFGATMILVSMAVFAAVSTNAERAVRDQLTSTGAVFDQVWALRSGRLQDGASLLARDFGFRSAIATNDQETINSALDNLKGRLNVDFAFMVGIDGSIIGENTPEVQAAAERMVAILGEGIASGVLTLGQDSYQAIAAPVLSPVLTGWVVFARQLDQGEMRALEGLSAIPIQATVLHREEDGWVSSSGRFPPDSATDFSEIIDRSIPGQSSAGAAAPQIKLKDRSGPSLAMVKSLESLDGGPPAVLLLRYPLTLAMEAYRPLLTTVLLTGLLGIALVIWGSWALARTVTRPLLALRETVRRLQAGERSHAPVETRDEIGALAQGFNEMADEIAEREARILRQATHDTETGLLNRPAYLQQLERLSADAATAALVVVAVSINRFEHVRGAIGYGPANALLQEVGRRAAALAVDGEVARLATATLAFSFRAPDAAQAQLQLTQALDRLEAPFPLEGGMIDVHLSVGMAIHGVHADEPGLLIERAGIGLSQARSTLQKVKAFDAEAYGDPAANLSLMSEMAVAMEDGSLDLFYQPKLDLRSRTINACEALVRWRHPVRGMLPPDLFIPMAEQTGHIRALTDWVLIRALRDQAVMLDAGHAMAVSINVSGCLLGDMEFAEQALKIAATAKGPLCFEITETAVIENPQVAFGVIDRFAAAGIAVSIDDYGSGLSSLAYLKQIRADELKIDKAFVLSIDSSAKDALLVRSTIDLAHSLGLKVTAEGVETEAGLALLSAMGCDVAQGYLIGRPTPLEGLLAVLDQEQTISRRYG
jgi:predicted signal transduction protein with EAL and GGDEF domain